MFIEFIGWMFINMMVATGLAFLSANPPLFRWLRQRPGYPWHAILGTSAMVIFCIVFPWKVGPGMQIDIRNVPLALLGWAHGWTAALPVSILIIIFRFLKGGFGAYTTFALTILCMAMLPYFQRKPRTLLWLGLHGVAQTAALYLVGQTMVSPQPRGLEPLSPYWLLITTITVLTFWLLNAANNHVNQKQHLEEALAAELGSKQAVLELIPYGILFLDRSGRLTGSNEAARNLLAGGQLIPQIREHPEIALALAEQRRVSGCRLTLPGPVAERIVLISAVPLQGGGAVLGIENVTGVVRAEREEAERNRLELLGNLAAMAAHEIKNPLTTIKGFLQLMVRRPEFAAHQSSFHLVLSEAEQINRVVSDFLHLAASPSHQPNPVAVDRLLYEVLDVMQLQFPSSRVRVLVQGEPGLVVWANEGAVKQILKNVVTNAYEAMPEGGDLVVTRSSAENQVYLSVRDTGPGIAPDVLPVIFTPYVTTKATGTGLGLVISHKLASELGGHLSIASEPGHGCTIRLALPEWRSPAT